MHALYILLGPSVSWQATAQFLMYSFPPKFKLKNILKMLVGSPNNHFRTITY